MTASELAARMPAEILDLVAVGIMPRDVRSFSELHDHVDAHCLGGAEGLFGELCERHPPTDDAEASAAAARIAIMGPASEIVDA